MVVDAMAMSSNVTILPAETVPVILTPYEEAAITSAVRLATVLSIALNVTPIDGVPPTVMDATRMFELMLEPPTATPLPAVSGANVDPVTTNDDSVSAPLYTALDDDPETVTFDTFIELLVPPAQCTPVVVAAITESTTLTTQFKLAPTICTPYPPVDCKLETWTLELWNVLATRMAEPVVAAITTFSNVRADPVVKTPTWIPLPVAPAAGLSVTSRNVIVAPKRFHR
jgi:hypothetical protein